jgi:hypothetical protein
MPRDDRQDDLFGPFLEKIINLRHPPVRLAAEMDWDFVQSPLDHTASDGHSYGCSSGSLLGSEASATSVSLIRAGWNKLE